MKDCEAICSPEYNAGITNTWLYFDYLWPSEVNVGGMMPIAFRLGDPSAVFNHSTFTLDIDGGRFVSINGATNAAEYIGGETNISRNAGIWISKAYTNFININFFNTPEFRLGNTNASVAFILNETTNNRVSLSGFAQVCYVPNGDRNAAGTNTLRGLNASLVLQRTISPPLAGLLTNEVIQWNSNNVLYGISSTKTNVITDLR